MAIDIRNDDTITERWVVRRLRDDASRRLLAEAINEIAWAAVLPRGGAARGVRSHGMLEASIASVTAVAIETLIEDLEDLVWELEPSALQELAQEQRLADLGIE